MSRKDLEVAPVGAVSIYKRRGVRSIRLTINPAGTIRVTLPKWAPYKLGIDFVLKRQDWIKAHRPRKRSLICSDIRVGKAHCLVLIASSAAAKISTRIKDNTITVSYPKSENTWSDANVQKAAEKACIRALRLEAQKLLPIRVEEIAGQYGFNYKSIAIKQLLSRWGSCNSQKELTFNLFLMQLPWPLIDYVILHELQHTKILRHGPTFWQAMTTLEPNLPELRKAIRQYHPVLLSELRV